MKKYFITIPATLEEAYKALDELLDPEDIEYIKNLTEDDIISMHFGLGMWIRNNWLYPTNSNLTKSLRKLNPSFGHPDDMSHFILTGYYHYLNDNKYSIETYKREIQKGNADALIQNLLFLFIFFFTVVTIRFLLKKAPRPTRFLERYGRPKFLRVLIILCVVSLLNSGAELLFYGRWSLVLTSVYIFISALILAISAIFFFADMTKRQIAISAILPTIFLLGYGLESGFFAWGIGYGFFGKEVWNFIFPINYVFLFVEIIGSYWLKYFNIIFALIPFVYLLLARTKNPANHNEIENPIDELSDENAVE